MQNDEELFVTVRDFRKVEAHEVGRYADKQFPHSIGTVQPLSDAVKYPIPLSGIPGEMITLWVYNPNARADSECDILIWEPVTSSEAEAIRVPYGTSRRLNFSIPIKDGEALTILDLMVKSVAPSTTTGRNGTDAVIIEVI